ncbi:MAG: hypothetical protein WBS19_11540 [Candidatus Korobacteraceae bacterium]
MTDSSTASVASSTGSVQAASRFAPLQVVILLVLLAAGGVHEARKLSALASPDIWRHLSAGAWILTNHAVPHNLIFSQSNQLPWIDSSWLFDVKTAMAVKLFGLRGLVWLDMTVGLAIAVAIFLLARGSRHGFWAGTLLTAIALYLISSGPLRSSIVSILLFAVVLTVITLARTTGSPRLLYWLPPLFLLWANLDIQFVYGLGTLLLLLIADTVGFLASESAGSWFVSRGRIPLPTTAVIAAASILATLCNPYAYRLWGAALRSVSLFSADPYFPEMHALRFRQPQDYVLLLLVMTAFFALGRRHARDLFSLFLLSACSIVSFHLQRDTWLVALAAVAVLSQALDAADSDEARNSNPAAALWVLPAGIAAALVVLMMAFAVRVPSARDVLLAKVSEKFPVRASDYIRQHDLPKPLFNNYDWGSFLTWYLPEYPVQMDTRTDSYGEELTLGYFNVTTGQVPLAADPALSHSQTILLEADSEMGKALSILPGYKQVYLDDQARVLVREN